ncbi:probable malonyl-CoA-acyl carrier protein transacylase, mitochondrial [Condylostylus longicornis]|uniref:probable malonyl-CoA-acyl carrier protein transacylase, mitochondrial n=1 Tax=Condylostylus longicornis TaxID=2530218 RepID=UPI00244DEFBF|nr:probable malonyl-CoA-acyl carrier protein transacylase, mitochondrial [Condylostylus longicornis]
MYKLFSRNIHRTSLFQCDNKSEKIKSLLESAVIGSDIKPTSPENQWSTLPYAEGTVLKRDQKLKSIRPARDPRECSIILFPGQGSQYVGMGKNLLSCPGSRDIFELANQVLNYDLLKICLEGPKSKLDKTSYCQPAVFVSSLAAVEKLQEERPNAIENCVATAGFSLGEITSLVFAGSIPFDKALKLIQVRAEAMQMACEMSEGGMATVLFGPDSEIGAACNKATQWCLEKGIEKPYCQVSNYLYPHCKIVAGHMEALRYLETNSKLFKIKRIKRLAVNGAFHTPLMESAVEPFRKALKQIPIEDPLISVHSNVDGKRYKNAGHILKQLPQQIVKPVKWEQTLHILYERDQGKHFPRTFECGPGKGLKAILKQVNAKACDSATNIEA